MMVDVGPKPRFAINWIGFFILGTINNFGYVVITSAAQSLSAAFNERNLIGLIPWANVALSLVVRSINAFFLDWMPYKWRMLVNTIFLLLGLVGLSMSVYVDFWFAIGMIVIVGGVSSFGESMLLGYMRLYPAKVVDGWSSGTGMAGVAGSAYYLAFSAAGVANEWIFLSLLPSAIIYIITYAVVLRRGDDGSSDACSTNIVENGFPPMVDGDDDISTTVYSKYSDDRSEHSGFSVNTLDAPLVLDCDDQETFSNDTLDTTGAPSTIEEGGKGAIDSEDNDPDESSKLIKPALNVEKDSSEIEDSSSTLSSMIHREDDPSYPSGKGENAVMRVWRCTKLVWWRGFMLFLVYVFEYVASTGGADKAESAHPHGWAEKHAYTILAFCYQAGVLISRSSLSCIKIRRIEILAALQGVNMVLWILQDEYKFMPVYAQFPIMVYVGLLGGAMYVNVFYLLLHDEEIPDEDRELCVNLVALAITAGITVASIAVLAMDNTFLAHK